MLYFSVDQLLSQREMDPELLLNNLGFGSGMQDDDTMTRVPDRFFLNLVRSPAVDQYELMLNHPELHHLLNYPELHHLLPVPVMGTNQLMHGSGQLAADSEPIHRNNVDVVDSGAGNQSENQQPRKGQLPNTNVLLETNVDIEPDLDNNNKCYARTEHNNHNVRETVPHSSRLLELCGIVPERYLIKNSRINTSAGSDEGMSIAIVEEGEDEESETESGEDNIQLVEENRVNKAENMPNDNHSSVMVHDLPQLHDGMRSSAESEVTSEKVVVEVDVHDGTCVCEEICDKESWVNAREPRFETADTHTDCMLENEARAKDTGEGRINIDEIEGFRMWSSTSSDSDPSHADLQLDNDETLV